MRLEKFAVCGGRFVSFANVRKRAVTVTVSGESRKIIHVRDRIRHDDAVHRGSGSSELGIMLL